MDVPAALYEVTAGGDFGKFVLQGAAGGFGPGVVVEAAPGQLLEETMLNDPMELHSSALVHSNGASRTGTGSADGLEPSYEYHQVGRGSTTVAHPGYEYTQTGQNRAGTDGANKLDQAVVPTSYDNAISQSGHSTDANAQMQNGYEYSRLGQSADSTAAALHTENSTDSFYGDAVGRARTGIVHEYSHFDRGLQTGSLVGAGPSSTEYSRLDRGLQTGGLVGAGPSSTDHTVPTDEQGWMATTPFGASSNAVGNPVGQDTSAGVHHAYEYSQQASGLNGAEAKRSTTQVPRGYEASHVNLFVSPGTVLPGIQGTASTHDAATHAPSGYEYSHVDLRAPHGAVVPGVLTTAHASSGYEYSHVDLRAPHGAVLQVVRGTANTREPAGLINVTAL